MSDELPEGWVWVPLGRLGEFINGDRGKNYPSKGAFVDAGIPFINAGHLEGGTVDLSAMNYITEERFDLLGSGKAREDDILYCLRGSLGKAAVVRGIPQGAIASSLLIVRPGSEVVAQYLYFFLVSPAGKDRIRLFDNGSAQPNLSAANVKQYMVPLAPLTEQRRIVAKVEALLTRVKVAQERLEKVTLLLKRFRQSVLAAACSGRLTEEWRADRDLPDWPNVVLQDHAIEFSYGSAAKSSKSGSVPVLRMGNIQDGRLDWADLVFTSDAQEIAKYRLRTGDVLFNRTNSPELVGKTAVFRGERDAIYAGYLIRVRCSERLLPDYLNYCLNGPAGRAYCSMVKSDGVSQSNINASKLAEFQLGLPSISEQHEIVSRTEALLVAVERIRRRMRQVEIMTNAVTKSVLSKAFEGELVATEAELAVAEGRGFESAEELLRRVSDAPNAEISAKSGETPTKRRGRARKAAALRRT